jgi:hypothetical protein
MVYDTTNIKFLIIDKFFHETLIYLLIILLSKLLQIYIHEYVNVIHFSRGIMIIIVVNLINYLSNYSTIHLQIKLLLFNYVFINNNNTYFTIITLLPFLFILFSLYHYQDDNTLQYTNESITSYNYSWNIKIISLSIKLFMLQYNYNNNIIINSLFSIICYLTLVECITEYKYLISKIIDYNRLDLINEIYRVSIIYLSVCYLVYEFLNIQILL